jgi:dTMP kinase
VRPAGTPGERARALLRLRPYRRLWVAQLVGGAGDRLGLLVLIGLTWVAQLVGGQLGHGYRGQALAVAAVLGARLLATLIFGAALLGPVHSPPRTWRPSGPSTSAPAGPPCRWRERCWSG